MAVDFFQNGPWEVPRGWAWAPLGQLGRWTGGGTPSKANAAFWTNGSIPWVSPKDMKVDVIEETEDSITEEAVVRSSTKLVSKNSILMVVRSGILKHTFPVAVCDRDVTMNQDMRALTPIECVDPRYLAFVLRRLQRHILDECSKDGTTVASVEPALLEKVLVPIPPLPEQRRIVARIDELFTEIADGETALARARDDLATWRRALLKAAVTGELTREWREHNKPNDTAAQMVESVRSANELAIKKGEARRFKFGPPRDDIRFPEIPERWQWIQLGQILAKIDAGLNVKADGRPPRDGETGIVKISAVTWGEFDEEESKTLASDAVIDERNIIRPGDFLISRANTLELVGAPVIVKACTKRLVLSDKVLRLHFFSGLQQWVEVCLKSPFGRHQIESYASGNQLSMRNISQENLLRIAIPLPPRSEIDHALRLLGFNQEQGFDGSISIDNGEKTSAALRQSILKAAFEGRLVEQDPDDEPAELMLTRLDNAAPKQKATPRRVKRPRDAAVGTDA